MTRFRLGISGIRTHNLHNGDDALCPFCRDTSEDEAHFLLECDTYTDLREKYLGRYMQYVQSRTFLFLIDGQGYVKTKHVAMYIHYALKRRHQRLLEDECISN